MLSVTELERRITATLPDWGGERRPLARAAGRVLREDLVADRPWPPFDRVAMDGVALRHAAWAAGHRIFPVAGIQATGSPRLRLTDPETCLEAMTGAVLPEGCDTIVPMEQLLREGNQVRILEGDLRIGQHIDPTGRDRPAGEVLLSVGARLDPAALAVAATIGAAQPLIARRPALAVISTGDELVGVDAHPLDHQIRRSNAVALRAAIEAAGWEVAWDGHAPDEAVALEAVLHSALREAEVLVLSGGISQGRFDLVPDALQAAGFELHSRRVAQRPGKPFVYGVGRRGGRARVFALPGNPVSSLICLHRFVLPALTTAEGCPTPPEYAELAEPVAFKHGLTTYLPVRLEEDGRGRHLARLVATAGSGDFAPLTASDGFLELPAERGAAAAGEALRLWRWSRRP
jgi:molybdopterin molybdotransferase